MTPSRTITATAVLSVATLASCGSPAQSHPTASRASYSALIRSRPAESMTATLIGAPEVQRRQTTARLADAVTGRIAADAAEEVAAQEKRDRAASATPAVTSAPPARAVAPTTTVVAAPRVTPRAFTGGGGGNTSGVSTDCESGSNYATNTGNGYYGAYQWLPPTFIGHLHAAGGNGDGEDGTTAGHGRPPLGGGDEAPGAAGLSCGGIPFAAPG